MMTVDLPELQRLFERDPVAIYHACKEIDDFPGEGSFPIFATRVLKFYGLVSRQFFYEPLTTFDRVRDSVFRQHWLSEAGVPRVAIEHLTVGFRMFESMYSAPLGVVPMPRLGDREVGRHVVAVRGGWDNGGESLSFVNSWGRGWGDGGWGSLTREYLERYMAEAWVGRNARYGPSLATYDRIAGAKGASALRSAWLQENPRWRLRRRFSGRGHQLVLYEAISMEDRCPVEIIEICDGVGRRVAWSHLFHLRRDGQRISLAKEFFVWPWFRRKGYGRWLLDLALDRAIAWHSNELLVHRYEADSFPRGRVAAQALATQAGFEWRYSGPTRPKVRATAWRTLV